MPWWVFIERRGQKTFGRQRGMCGAKFPTGFASIRLLGPLGPLGPFLTHFFSWYVRLDPRSRRTILNPWGVVVAPYPRSAGGRPRGLGRERRAAASWRRPATARAALRPKHAAARRGATPGRPQGTPTQEGSGDGNGGGRSWADDCCALGEGWAFSASFRGAFDAGHLPPFRSHSYSRSGIKPKRTISRPPPRARGGENHR